MSWPILFFLLRIIKWRCHYCSPSKGVVQIACRILSYCLFRNCSDVFIKIYFISWETLEMEERWDTKLYSFVDQNFRLLSRPLSNILVLWHYVVININCIISSLKLLGSAKINILDKFNVSFAIYTRKYQVKWPHNLFYFACIIQKLSSKFPGYKTVAISYTSVYYSVNGYTVRDYSLIDNR